MQTLSDLIFSIENWPDEGHILDLNLSPEVSASLVALPNEEPPRFKSPLTGSLELYLLQATRLRVKGVFQARVEMACDRCLADIAANLSAEVDELLELGAAGSQAKLPEDAEELNSCLPLVDGRFNLAPLLGELFWLSWPYRFICKAECQGLCLKCGANLNYGLCSCMPGDKNFDSLN